MNDDFYFEESNPKKAMLTFFIIIVIGATIFLGFTFFRDKYTLNIKKVIKYEAGDVISYNIKDYVKNDITNEDDYKLNFNGVIKNGDILDTIGEYTYKVTYKGVTKTGKIKVVDTKAPDVKIDTMIIGVDEEFNPYDAITSCTDFSLPCNISLVNETDENISKTPGFYKVPIYISDVSGNKLKTTIEVEVRRNYNSIEVKEKDLTIDHISEGYDTWDGEVLIKFKKAHDEQHLDEVDEYDDILASTEGDMHRYLDPLYKNNRIDAVEMVRLYNKYNYIVGITYYIKIDSGKEFYLKK